MCGGGRAQFEPAILPECFRQKLVIGLRNKWQNVGDFPREECMYLRAVARRGARISSEKNKFFAFGNASGLHVARHRSFLLPTASP